MKKSKSYMHAKLFFATSKDETMTLKSLYTITLGPSSSSLTFLLSSTCVCVCVCVCGVCVCVWCVCVCVWCVCVRERERERK